MKIKSIKIHNFRSIKEAEFNCYDYNVLVGANDSGKSNILTALRIFYEDGIKFDNERDFPKFPTDDDESWIEIEYYLTNDEYETLKDEYKGPNNTLKVRKYLKAEQGSVRPNQSNIYGYYKSGRLSNNLFYGARNISEAKLGSVTYIPSVSKIDEEVKLSGPSPLRNVLNFVMKKVAESGEAYGNLRKALEEFNTSFKEEASKDGFSFSNLKEEINNNLSEWDVEFDFNINPIRPEDLIKYMFSCNMIDKNLAKEIDVKNFGQGFQRYLIYTLIKLSSQYTEKKTYEKKGIFARTRPITI